MNSSSRKAIWALLFVTGLGACDEISDPLADQEQVISDTGDPQFNDTVYNDTNNTSRRILLEDFTGHKCPNCPFGTDIAKQLMDDNPNDVILAAIHNSSNFSKPEVPDFPNNFETESGERLRVEFQVGAFPNGLINRTELSGSFVVGNQLWENSINQLLGDPSHMQQRFRIKLMNIYNTESRILRIIPSIESLTSTSGDVFLVVYLLEDGIISPQIDNRATPAYIPDYKHDHLLRLGFPSNGEGRLVFTDAASGDVYAPTLGIAEEELRITLEEAWKPENMDVVVFLTSGDTRAVLQVERVPMMNP